MSISEPAGPGRDGPAPRGRRGLVGAVAVRIPGFAGTRRLGWRGDGAAQRTVDRPRRTPGAIPSGRRRLRSAAATAEPLVLKTYPTTAALRSAARQVGRGGPGGYRGGLPDERWKGRIDGNHARCSWVRLTGKVEPRGLLVLSHRDNFRSPQAVRIHPKMPYFVFSPCVDGEFRISRGRAASLPVPRPGVDGEMTPEECRGGPETTMLGR